MHGTTVHLATRLRGGGIAFFVQTLAEETVRRTLQDYRYVDDLLAAVHPEIPANLTCLVHEGPVLESGRTLENYGIQYRSLVRVLLTGFHPVAVRMS